MPEDPAHPSSLRPSAIPRSLLIALSFVLALAFFYFSAREGQYALFVGVLTVSVTAYGIIRQQEGDRQDRLALEQRERVARQEEARRDKKIEAYNDVIEVWLGLLVGTDQEKKKLQANAQKRFGDNVKMLIPWGADDVLIALSAMREAAGSGDPDMGKQLISRFTDLLLAIRADLGYENRDVDGYTIASTFINDLSREKWDEWARA